MSRSTTHPGCPSLLLILLTKLISLDTPIVSLTHLTHPLRMTRLCFSLQAVAYVANIKSFVQPLLNPFMIKLDFMINPEWLEYWPTASFDVGVVVSFVLVTAWVVVCGRTMWYHDVTQERDRVYKAGVFYPLHRRAHHTFPTLLRFPLTLPNNDDCTM